MRPVTTALNNALLRTDGARFRWLIAITPAGGAPRHLCADSQTVGGITYIGELLTISPVYEAINSVGDLTIEVLDNTANRASCALAAEIIVSLWAMGTTAADASVLFHGELSDPISRHAGKISADAVSFANLGSRRLCTPLATTEFPGADPNSIGQVKPIIYGSVQGAPCLAVDAGSITTLVSPVMVGDTLITVTSAASFPASGTIQIDTEQLAYSAKTATSFIIAAAAIAHDKGAQVAELQIQYDYLIADHPIRAVSNIYVDGVRQLGTDFTIILNDPIDHTSKIRFTTLPTLVRQVNLVADPGQLTFTDTSTLIDGIEVLDTIKVLDTTVIADPGHSHAVSSTGSITAITRLSASVSSGALTFGYLASSVMDGNWYTSALNSYYPFALTISQSIAGATGTPISANITVKARPLSAVDSLGTIVANDTGSIVVAGGWIGDGLMFSAAVNNIITRDVAVSWAGLQEMVINCSVGGWQVYEVIVNSVTYGSSAGVTSSAAGVTKSGKASKSGTVIKSGTGITYSGGGSIGGNILLTGNSVADTKIGGVVTVDCEGYADDSTGTITGTASALIERPDHVTRHLLIHHGGVTASRAAAVDFATFTGERLSVHLSGYLAVRTLIADIARQVGAITAYSAGRWIMRQRPAPTTPPVVTITDSGTLRLQSGASSAVETSTGLRKLKNRHRWRCGKAPSGNGWLAADTINAITSQTSYGVREEMVDLDYVPTSAQAITLVNWLAAREANPLRKVLHLQLLLGHYSLEIGDVVRTLNNAAGVDVTGDVIAIGPRPLAGQGNGSMTVTIEEA